MRCYAQYFMVWRVWFCVYESIAVYLESNVRARVQQCYVRNVKYFPVYLYTPHGHRGCANNYYYCRAAFYTPVTHVVVLCSRNPTSYYFGNFDNHTLCPFNKNKCNRTRVYEARHEYFCTRTCRTILLLL